MEGHSGQKCRVSILSLKRKENIRRIYSALFIHRNTVQNICSFKFSYEWERGVGDCAVRVWLLYNAARGARGLINEHERL